MVPMSSFANKRTPNIRTSYDQFLMSAPSPRAANCSSEQGIVRHRSHRSPERPRGKSKRKLVKIACTTCQKRKSRCDGQRPTCSRCKALHTQCRYTAEAGESRWSALRRKTDILERERDEAREIFLAIHSRLEPEAQEIYNRVRSSTSSDDIGALIHEVREATSCRHMVQQQLQQYQRDSSLHCLDHQHQQAQQSQQIQHQQPTISQTHLAATVAGPGFRLPPLRSMVDMPPAGSREAPKPFSQQFIPLKQPVRDGSFESGPSSDSYSSLSSFDGQRRHTTSQREEPMPTWGHGDGQHPNSHGGR